MCNIRKDVLLTELQSADTCNMGKAGECLCLYVTSFSTSSSVGDLMHALMSFWIEDIALHMLKG